MTADAVANRTRRALGLALAERLKDQVTGMFEERWAGPATARFMPASRGRPGALEPCR